MTTKRAINLAEVSFSVAVLCLGMFMIIQTVAMGGGPQYAAVGPRAFPVGISAGLLLLGVMELWSALKGSTSGAEKLELDWKAFAIVAGALAIQLSLLPLLGWIPVALILFVAVAYALGNRSCLANAGFGLGMAIVTFLIFNYVLGLGLPWGSLFEPLATRFGLT